MVTLEDLSAAPFPCANCFGATSPEKVQCSELCKAESECVRYIRKRRREGREHSPDVAEAIRFKLAHIAAGGYDKAGRELSAAIRRAVIDRDRGLCRACGQLGKDIDHISGASDARENLQLLCKSCHNAKTEASLVPLGSRIQPVGPGCSPYCVVRTHLSPCS